MMNYNSNQLSDIDAVEVVNLRGIYADRVNEYMKESIDAPHVRVVGDLAQQIATLWRELLPGGQMRCHNPQFGLRFYSNDKLLLQGSICWECNNIFGDISGKEFLYEFDAEHPISQKLLVACQQSFDEAMS